MKQITDTLGVGSMTRGHGRRVPKSEAHVRLGQELRRIRMAAGLTTRDIKVVGSGHVSNVENGHAAPSMDMIEAYCKLGADKARLISLYSQIPSVQQINQDSPAQGAGDGSNSGHFIRDEVVKLYTVESLDCIYKYAATGVIEYVRIITSIRAKRPGTSIYYAGYHYQADPRRGAIRVEAGSGCEITETKEHNSGLVETYFRSPSGLNPEDAEPHSLTYQVFVNTDVRDNPKLVHCVLSDLLRYSVKVQFERPSIPTRIWWFQSETDIDDLDPAPSQVFSPDSSEFYWKEFRNPIRRWHYGLRWQWAS